jgi:hypothetical protein
MALALVAAGTTSAVWFKLLLYGNSGSGKTWRASKARKPGDWRKVLGLLTEANGVQSARHANPDLLLPSWPLTQRVKVGEKDGKPVMADKPVLDPTTKQPMVRHYATKMEEVREVLRAVTNREIPDLDTLVIDGWTEIQAMMKDEMMEMKRRAVEEGRAKKEALVFSKADWGELGEKMRRAMRSVRDLPIHVVATALAEVETEEEGDKTTRYTIPSFQGRKLANQIAQFQNVVGYCYTVRGRDSGGKTKITHLAMVEGPETILCKPAHPLGGVLEIPLHDWLDLLAKPPADGAVVGRELTDEEKRALEAAEVEGAEEAKKRKAKEEQAEPLPDPDAPQVDLSAGQEAPKEAPKSQPQGETQGSTGRVRRAGRGGPK